MKEIIQGFIRFTYSAHEAILRLNDAYEARLSDKELHFLVFGIAGAGVFLLSWAVFQALRKHIGCLAWLFSLMVITMLALSVEVGQGLSGSGAMDAYDIAWGVAGFAAFSAAVFAAAAIMRGLYRLIGGGKKPNRSRARR